MRTPEHIVLTQIQKTHITCTELLEKALEQIPDTFTIKHLAKKAGVSDPTARKFCKKRGLLPNQDGLYNKKPMDLCPNPTPTTPNPNGPLDKTPQPPTEVYTDLYIMAYMKGFDQGFQKGFEQAKNQQ
jgi:hypothetical protein